MKTVSDASVLIFLGKIRQLHLIEPLFDGPFYLPDLVYREVLTEGLSTEETEYLTQALSPWKTMSPRRPSKPGTQLSLSDWSVVELAKQVKAELVLADEKALRNVLVRQHLTVMGTLGILIRATQKKLLTREQTRVLMDALVSSHRFYVSAETYQVFLKRLQADEG